MVSNVIKNIGRKFLTEEPLKKLAQRLLGGKYFIKKKSQDNKNLFSLSEFTQLPFPSDRSKIFLRRGREPPFCVSPVRYFTLSDKLYSVA